MKIHVVLWSQRVFFNMKREEQRKRKKRREKTSHFKTYRANQKSRVKVWPCLLIGGIFDYLSIFWLAVINWQVCCDWLLVNRSRDSYHSIIVRFASSATRGLLSLLLLSLSSLFATKENPWKWQGSFQVSLEDVQTFSWMKRKVSSAP